ncbi:MAG: phosphoribosylanthranilate isomerase [archaeon]|nr:MAG: phosphoribosylanthranilate isomerase [archaeon]
MVRVKICGLTREEDVSAAVRAGADAVGFISGFPKSPRNVTFASAGRLMRRVPPFVDRVLVTTVEAVVQDIDAIRMMGLDAIQLYGQHPDFRELRRQVDAMMIRPYLIGGPQNGLKELDKFDAVLSDTFVDGKQGGTGKTSDWAACRRLRETLAPMPFILSGGLNPMNVADAIASVAPFAVDASSGVESSPGIKDVAKIEAFVEAAARWAGA